MDTPVRDSSKGILGRDEQLDEIGSLLTRGHNVLVFGPAQLGKTAIIQALGSHRAIVMDPLEHVSPRLAGRILHGMDRYSSYLAAARTLDRHYLGAVRRIAWRFTSVRIPPLPDRWMKRLVEREWAGGCPTLAAPSDAWIRSFLRLAQGRPGFAIAMIKIVARRHEAKNVLTSPPVAYAEALIRSADFSRLGALESDLSIAAAES
jgi:hypothetical protein